MTPRSIVDAGFFFMFDSGEIESKIPEHILFNFLDLYSPLKSLT